MGLNANNASGPCQDGQGRDSAIHWLETSDSCCLQGTLSDERECEEDGIQLVIDDRTFEEYFNERIATPHFYDKPILYPLQLLQKPFFMNLFFMLFQGKEVIIYCRSANRSYIGATLLLDNGFEGTLYNMLGGINAWKAEGLPTVKGFGFGKLQ